MNSGNRPYHKKTRSNPGDKKTLFRRSQGDGKGTRKEPVVNRSHPREKRGNQTIQPGIPPLLEELITAYIREKIGKEPDDPSFLIRLRQSVMAQKASYWSDKPGKLVKYGRAYDIFAYLAYHLPVYFTQFRSILQNLENDGVLPNDATLLDIGSGPGIVPLAMIDVWRTLGKGSLEICALDQSDEHREAFRALVRGYSGPDPAITIHDPIQGDLVRISKDGHIDLPKKATIISFQNVLAELEHLSIPVRAAIIQSFAKILDEQGFIIIVEPAELRHATSLRLLQQELIKGGLHVYAPCSYIWGSGCDPSSCWTFTEEPSIAPTTLMNKLAGDDEGYRFINTDIKYSYLILTKKSISRYIYRVPRKNRMVRLAHLERHNGRMINVTASRMSEDIGTRGMHIFKLCDGTCREPVYAVLSTRNRRPGHSLLFSSSYGNVLMFSGVQVRRHPKHKAWNLIINADSEIARAIMREPSDNLLVDGISRESNNAETKNGATLKNTGEEQVPTEPDIKRIKQKNIGSSRKNKGNTREL